MDRFFNKFLPQKLIKAMLSSQLMVFSYEDINLTNSDLSILLMINNNIDITSSEIASSRNFSKSYVSQVVSRLERKDCVFRKQLPEHKRFYGLYVTDKGALIAKAFSDYIIVCNKSIFDNLLNKHSVDEIENFVKIGDDIGSTMLEFMADLNNKISLDGANVD